MAGIDMSVEGDGDLLRVSGELDADSVPSLERMLRRSAPNVQLDLRGCTFFDSSGIAALINARAGSNPELEIVEMSTRVRRVLTLTGLDTVFGVAPPDPVAET